MNIDHLTGSVTTRGGGIPIALHSLLGEQLEAGLLARLIGWVDGGEAVGDWRDGVLQALKAERRWGIPSANGMRGVVCSGQAQILHLHGLWTDASRVTLGQHLPYVVSPHGMLDSWALQHSAFKKKMAAAWFEGRNLRRATCMHALCDAEAQSIRQFGLTNPIAIIPNGVHLPVDTGAESGASKIRTLLFLGRLHPKKGLVNLLSAWGGLLEKSKVGDESWELVIAGWDQGGHREELETLCRNQAIPFHSLSAGEYLTSSVQRPSVLFLGPAFGEEKELLLRCSDAFVLPSFSEGLPMAILEAWAHGLPVMMTDHCNLSEGFNHQAAIRIETESGSITQGLRALTGMSSEIRADMGKKGRQLVEKNFTWKQVAAQMKQVYEWVLGKHEMPGCVVDQRKGS